MSKKLLTVVLFLIFSMSTSVTVFAEPKDMGNSDIFDAEFYAATYPDIVAVIGNDEAALYNHYVQYGKAEGRLPYANANIEASLPVIDNSAYEYIAAEGYNYLMQRDASSLNPGTVQIINIAKVPITNDNSWFLFHKMADSGVVILYQKVNDNGLLQTHSMLFMQSQYRTKSWNQIISPNGGYVTVINMAGDMLKSDPTCEFLNIDNVLNINSNLGTLKWNTGKNNHIV